MRAGQPVASLLHSWYTCSGLMLGSYARACAAGCRSAARAAANELVLGSKGGGRRRLPDEVHRCLEPPSSEGLGMGAWDRAASAACKSWGVKR